MVLKTTTMSYWAKNTLLLVLAIGFLDDFNVKCQDAKTDVKDLAESVKVLNDKYETLLKRVQNMEHSQFAKQIAIVNHKMDNFSDSDVIKGKFEYVYDDNDTSCATLQNRGDVGWYHVNFSESARVGFVWMKWNGPQEVKNFFKDTILRVAACVSPTCQMTGTHEYQICGWDRTDSDNWHRFNCPAEKLSKSLFLYFPNAYLDKRNPELCSIKAYEG